MSRRLPFDGEYRVTQGWGERPNVYAAVGLPGHNGIDFGLPDQTPVLAPDDAEAIEVEFDEYGYGYYVKLRTAAGEDWLLAHLHPWHLPRTGEWLASGVMVGYSGSTGWSTGAHLHCGYRPVGVDHSGPWRGWAPPPLPLP